MTSVKMTQCSTFPPGGRVKGVWQILASYLAKKGLSFQSELLCRPNRNEFLNISKSCKPEQKRRSPICSPPHTNGDGSSLFPLLSDPNKPSTVRSDIVLNTDVGDFRRGVFPDVSTRRFHTAFPPSPPRRFRTALPTGVCPRFFI